MQTPQDSFKEIFTDVAKVLVVLAHPDDMEINCGGLIARLIENKKLIRLVVTTDGGKGTKEKFIDEKMFAKTRIEEQIIAGNILGISEIENFNLQIPDGGLETTVENIEKISFHLRQFKPDLVITHNPHDSIIHFFDQSTWINHRDHKNTAQITIDAIYPYARNTAFFPKHFTQNKLTTHTVKKLLLTDHYIHPEVRYFAIEKFLDKKKKALQQHTSAFAPTDADDYIEENKIGDGYFESLGYYEIY